jgi:hypothetical protein
MTIIIDLLSVYWLYHPKYVCFFISNSISLESVEGYNASTQEKEKPPIKEKKKNKSTKNKKN